MQQDEKNYLDEFKEFGFFSGHFVYKAGYKHGDIYIDKEKFARGLGAVSLVIFLQDMVKKAVQEGLSFGEDQTEIGVIGPAYGASAFPLVVAFHLSSFFPWINFFYARTELKEEDEIKKHYLPDKLVSEYQNLSFIGVEDVVNNGTTIREVSQIFEEQANASVTDFLCLIDRGGKTAEELGLRGFYPLTVLDCFRQFDLEEEGCLLCEEGVPINTEIGKGKEWVKKFGQPPYSPDTDFSRFWK